MTLHDISNVTHNIIIIIIIIIIVNIISISSSSSSMTIMSIDNLPTQSRCVVHSRIVPTDVLLSAVGLGFRV